MGRKRYNGISEFFSGVGTERRFIQVGNKFLQHPNYRRLPATARIVYLAMGMEAGGKREAEFSHGMAKKYGISKSTFDRAVNELISKGFIARIKNADMSQFAKAKFKLCTSWKIDSS